MIIPQSPLRPRRRNRIVWVVGVLLGIVIIGYMVVARIAYDTMSLTGNLQAIVTPQVPFVEVSFPSRSRNYPVYAYWMPTNPNAPAIINVHGYKITRNTDFIAARAKILFNLNYNVLSIDLSDNGGKTIEDGRISMGFDERYDVLGAYDYLISNGFKPDQIGLYGESMGAATSLMAANLEPAIKVIWADSPYTDATLFLTEQAELAGYPGIIISGGMIWAQLVTGDRIWEASPIKGAASLAQNKQAVYLVTCGVDPVLNPHHSRDLFKEFKDKGVDVQFWEIGCIKHVTGIDFAHDEYVQRMNDFFKAKLAPNQ